MVRGILSQALRQLSRIKPEPYLLALHLMVPGCVRVVGFAVARSVARRDRRRRVIRRIIV